MLVALGVRDGKEPRSLKGDGRLVSVGFATAALGLRDGKEPRLLKIDGRLVLVGFVDFDCCKEPLGHMAWDSGV